MKIALTGPNGMLGSDITKVFRDVELTALTHNDLDITDLNKSLNVIRGIKPDFLIHGAAYTNVDGCETNPEQAYLVNGIGARNVAIACEEIRCPVIYVSSDYVFDGTKAEPYNEWDGTNPLNRYGLSKLLGEQFVKSMTNRYYIVRTSWLFGKSGKNFVDTIAKLLSERDSLDVVNDQTGSPTYTHDLALKLRDLIGKGYGTYHITNSSHCSWHDFAVEIARIKGLKKQINPVTSDKMNRPAKRPAFSVLGNTMLGLEGIRPLRSWKEALAEYLRG